MSGEPPVPPGRVPTLTEVVAWPEAAAPVSSATFSPASLAASSSASSPASSPAPASFEPVQTEPAPNAQAQAQLTERVLADVQRQIDLMLDYRLREVLTPLLSRMADHLVRDARTELASTLREVVSLAVAQELSRHRVR